MSENIVTSTSLNDVEKTPAKKAPAKKAAAKPKEVSTIEKEAAAVNGDCCVVVIFECGAAYSGNGLLFTREDSIQEVTQEQADFLLTLENFRTPDALELEEYLASKED
jgi:hypothetical protein